MSENLNRHPHLWFYVGLSFTGICLGYMVGASNSPVVGSVIPGVFGLVVLAFGVLGGEVSHAAVRGQSHADALGQDIRQWSLGGVRFLGIALTVFAASYFCVAIFGTGWRTVASRPVAPPFLGRRKPVRRMPPQPWSGLWYKGVYCSMAIRLTKFTKFTRKTRKTRSLAGSLGLGWIIPGYSITFLSRVMLNHRHLVLVRSL